MPVDWNRALERAAELKDVGRPGGGLSCQPRVTARRHNALSRATGVLRPFEGGLTDSVDPPAGTRRTRALTCTDTFLSVSVCHAEDGAGHQETTS